MVLVVGTSDGIYASTDGDGLQEVRNGVDVRRLLADESSDRWYAATDAGLLVAESPAEDWTELDLPRTDLWAVERTPTGDLLVGTHDPADLYRSRDGEETWTKNDRFANLPRHDEWDNLASTSVGRVRPVQTHPDAPHRIVAGVEAEGVFVSENDGRSWDRRVRGLNHDVHHLLVRGKDEFVAATGRGMYRTTDAGRRWEALDTQRDQFWYTYYRELLDHRGVLYACGQDRAEARFEADAGSRIMVSTDEGRSFALETFPGCDADYVNAWAVHDDRPVGGTVGGRLVAREDEEWVERGAVQATVRALASAE